MAPIAAPRVPLTRATDTASARRRSALARAWKASADDTLRGCVSHVGRVRLVRLETCRELVGLFEDLGSSDEAWGITFVLGR